MKELFLDFEIVKDLLTIMLVDNGVFKDDEIEVIDFVRLNINNIESNNFTLFSDIVKDYIINLLIQNDITNPETMEEMLDTDIDKFIVDIYNTLN